MQVMVFVEDVQTNNVKYGQLRTVLAFRHVTEYFDLASTVLYTRISIRMGAKQPILLHILANERLKPLKAA
jgi:hypothetical protein